MLQDLTPIQAAETHEGKHDVLDLLAFYDKCRSNVSANSESLDFNVPTKWALWKLGITRGDAGDFAAEEEIYNYLEGDNPPKATQRSEKSKQRLAKRHRAIFVPVRCELQTCDSKTVHKRASCHCAAYCSLEHQRRDWDRHKIDCKHLSKSMLTKVDFDSDKELAKYPIGCFPLPDPPKGTVLHCFICGAGDEEVQLGFTSCCNAPVCDNAHEYEAMSYSREFCRRSHDLYTCCGYHEDHKDDVGYAKDWRKCIPCKDMNQSKPARSWYSTNGYNLTPALPEDIPKGSYITRACAMENCRRRITPGHDGVTHMPGVMAEDGYTGVCDVCSGQSAPQTTFRFS